MNEENNEIIENMTQEERDKWHAVSNFKTDNEFSAK